MVIKDASWHCSEAWFTGDRKPVVNRARKGIGRFWFITN